MNRLTAIVQVTDVCNLRCKYCYVGGAERSHMSEETFEVIVDSMLDYVGPDSSISIVYHGGEPLARGLDFFANANRIIQERGGRKRIHTSLQTNGTLIDDRVADFIVQSRIDVGVSLDGPKEVHDANRYFMDGKGSFDATMAGIQKLRERGHDANGLAVITKKSLPHIREIYDFFNSNGINLKVNPVDMIGRSKNERQALEITPEEYGGAMVELFDAWYSDKESKIVIDSLLDIMKSVTLGVPHGCLYSNKACGSRYIGITPSGDVYPCARFTYDKRFNCGNIQDLGIKAILEHPILEQFAARGAQLTECNGCDYRTLCNGGCRSRANSYADTIQSRDYYCPATKMIFGHIINSLEKTVMEAA